MGRSAHPKAHGSDSRDSGEGRLDPVRWRRPARGTLLRLVAVAVLLGTAALASWSPPQPCGDHRSAAAAPEAAAAPATGDASGARTPHSSGPADPGRSASPLPSGSVGVPVRLADPTALSLVRAGNRVDLLRVDDPTGRTTSVAASALVLKVTGAGDPTAGGLLLALSPTEAARAVATSGRGFAVLIRPG